MSSSNEKLLAAYLAGEDVADELLQACRENPELLKTLTDLSVVDRLLAFQANDEEDTLFVDEVKERLAPNSNDHFVDDVRDQLKNESEKKKMSFFPVYAIAACFAAAFLIFQYSNFGTRPTLAQLRTSTGAVWANQTSDTKTSFSKGTYRLEKGYSEITMKNGVRLILEAPIEFEIKSEQLISVNQGRLVARVPEAAIGFTVLTPSSEIIDLGTEFGISVDNDGASEVHVLEGEVKARHLQQKTFSNLIKHEAMAFDESQQTSIIQSNPELFLRALPGRSAANPQYLHWACENDGPEVHCDGTGIDGFHYPGRLMSLDQGEGPSYQNGQFGDALYFNGKDAYVATDFPGIGEANPRTVAFWAKVPKDFTQEDGYGMLGWGLMERGSAWQVSPNPAIDGGLLGRLRIGTMNAPIVGTTDLRDNRWHHIAIVMYGGDDADVSTHILLYVDGKLEKTSLKTVAKINTELDNPESRPLMFGRNMAFRRDSKKEQFRFFRGWLDEIYVFDTALEQEKIQSLMENNSLEPQS